MVKRLLAIAFAIALICGPVRAWHFGSVVIGTSLSLSLGQSDLPGAFINWMKACSNAKGSGSPSALDANGYPNAGALSAPIYVACIIPTLTQYSSNWEMGWSGTGAIAFLGPTISVSSDPQACNKGGGQFAGTNCDVIFTITSSNNTPTLQFNTGFTYSGMNSAFLVRSVDKSAYVAGQVWSTEFLNIVKALNVPYVRTMGMTFPVQVGMFENSSGWNYRTPQTAFTYAGSVWFPNLWSASITGADQYTASGATDTPVSWTDREMLQGNFPNPSAAAISVTALANNGSGLVRLTVSSTATLTTNQQVLFENYNNSAGNAPPTVWAVTVIDGTHVDLQGSSYSASWSVSSGFLVTTTINIAGRGAKFVTGATILGSPGISAGQNGTLVYDATLAVLGTSPTTPVGAMVYTPGAVNAGVPIEAQVNLANSLNVPLWFNIPPYYQSASVGSQVSYVCGNALKTPYVEYNNENWNNGAPLQGQWFDQHGFALGLSLGSNVAPYSAIGVAYIQSMKAATAACPSIQRVNGAQAHGIPSQFDSYQFQGQMLCGTSCGNSFYQAFVGTDYNVSPNRPIDYTDDIAIAPYFGGAQENGNNGTLSQLTGACNGSICTGIIAAAACFAAPSNSTCGTGGTAQLALNFVDSDTRNGTFTDGTGGTSTAFGLQASVYTPWNAVAVSEGKKLIAYEGGFSNYGPSASYLTSIGDANASTNATNINNLIIAYRSSALLASTYQYWNQVWFSNSQVVANANLELEGPAPTAIAINAQYWGLMVGTYLDGNFYQNYLGACAINKSSVVPC